MRTRILLAASIAFAMSGTAYAKCSEIADVDGFGPQTKMTLCDDQATGILLNLDRMAEAPASMNGYLVPAPSAEIRLQNETVEAEGIKGWAQDRATNRGFILSIEDFEAAQKVARAINAGDNFDIVLTDSSGVSFTVFSGTFEMKFPAEMLE
jgi:hypothetical protein